MFVVVNPAFDSEVTSAVVTAPFINDETSLVGIVVTTYELASGIDVTESDSIVTRDRVEAVATISSVEIISGVTN